MGHEIRMPGIPIIEAQGISKSFSGRKVLNGLNLDLLPGEIHGLVGQNGSGKSTFIKVLSGYYAPDPGGSLKFNGVPVALPLAPNDPAKLGMSFVHQDLGLVDEGTVLENLRVGQYRTRFGGYISWKDECLLAQQALARFNLELDLNAELSSLKQVEKVIVAIVRAIERIREVEHGALILDEPTSYLPRDDVDRLFAAVREVAVLGHGVIFVSHRIEEVLELTQRVTVLRDSRGVGTFETKDLNEESLIEEILGFKLEDLYPEPHPARDAPAFSATHITGKVVSGFGLEARTGEIVGLTGLAGMGQEEVLYLLFGAQKARSGSMTIGNDLFELAHFSSAQAIRAGLGLVPGNRLKDGASPTAAIRENMTLPMLGEVFKHGVLSLKSERKLARELMGEFDVRPGETEQSFNTFSGGNQQKALLAKWMAVKPRILLLDEPCQGVDVGARKQIFGLIRKAADQGVTVLIASTEYEDLAALCDRVLVFRDGSVISELSRGNLSKERIVEQCYRSKESVKLLL